MSDLGRVCVVSCFWLIATAAASGANPATTGMSQTEAAETTRPPPSPQDRPAEPASQAPSGNPLWGIPLKQLSATRDRPIFSPSRRPPQAVVAPVVAVALPPVQQPKQPDRPPLVLVGTIVNGDDGFAIFMDQTTNAPLRIRIGADYQGWMLRSIEARSVTLKKGQETVVLAFPKPTNGQSTAAGSADAMPDPPAPPPPQVSPAQAPTPYLSPESASLRMPARPRRNPAQRR